MLFSGKRNRIILIVTCCFFHACTSNVQAPVESPEKQQRTVKSGQKPLSVKQSRLRAERPSHYIVRRGDTLYSIAWNYGFDYRDVAGWNGIRSPYTIYPGQKIRLVPPARPTTKQLQSESPVNKQQPDTETQAGSTSASSPVKKSGRVTARKPITTSGSVKWSWPANGRIIQADTPISKNGIDISGRVGQQILAAAPGEVVYSGSGLLGYGRLIIIKHDETYLSAYAHNKELLVKEGDRVTVGQKIALMGQTSNGRTILHFEIRKNGQPVNPLTYLPRI